MIIAMPQIFTWFPDASISKTTEPRVASAKFGDGYEQRVGSGINNMLDTWSLSFTGSVAETNDIEAFLRWHGGVVAFTWTTPDGNTGLYICRKWGKQRERSAKVVMSCEFEQVPA